MDWASLDKRFFEEHSIVVTGSNGKGSVSNFLFNILRQTEKHVGLFTSPHLYDYKERFKKDDNYISDVEFSRYREKVKLFQENILSPEKDEIGAFEALVCIAMLWFSETQPDVIVWEAGIGGRYDTTRVLSSKLSVLTSLDLEHTELLGDSLELIAYDKLDVTASGGHSIISSSIDISLYDRLRSYAHITDKNLLFCKEKHDIEILDYSKKNTRFHTTLPFSSETFEFDIPFFANYQAENANAAIQAACLYLDKIGGKITHDEIQQGLTDFKYPGRLELISDSPKIWIDVGHSPDAVQRTANEIIELFSVDELLIVFGASANKSFGEMSSIVDSSFKNILITRAHKNGASPDVLRPFFKNSNVLTTCEDIEDAVDISQKIAIEKNLSIFVLGGFFLSSEFAYSVRGGDPKELIFF